ncbi:MAG: hypothetical protein IJR59_00495 [Firmicutes bacterium]|nr:hypothetical protein [Bacillota bacterium]
MYKGKSEPKVMFWIMLVMGVILLVVGLYFWIIVAGISYQDPTEEMQKKWEFYLKLGEKILFFGMVLLSGGIVGNAVNFKNKRNGVKEND